MIQTLTAVVRPSRARASAPDVSSAAVVHPSVPKPERGGRPEPGREAQAGPVG